MSLERTTFELLDDAGIKRPDPRSSVGFLDSRWSAGFEKSFAKTCANECFVDCLSVSVSSPVELQLQFLEWDSQELQNVSGVGRENIKKQQPDLRAQIKTSHSWTLVDEHGDSIGDQAIVR